MAAFYQKQRQTCVVLQLSIIHLNRPELQYHIQPMHKSGAVSSRK